MTTVANTSQRDSLICFIPMSVTADLGVAMKRVRNKRIEAYKKLYPDHFQHDDKKASKINSSDMEIEGSTSQNQSDNESDGGLSQERSKLKAFGDGTEVRREQFSSIVDYLEAKYSKGVMIDDLDQRIRQKRNDKGEDAVGDNFDVFSDSDHGSCYTDDSGGFLDDSDLRIDVAQQILATSAYGTTKIEADAKKKKSSNDNDEDDFDADDFAFFVNIGDLEMEEGYDSGLEEERDWVKSMKTKGKKRKRATKDGNTKEKLSTKKTKDNGKKKEDGKNKVSKPNEVKTIKSPAKDKLDGDDKSTATATLKTTSGTNENESIEKYKKESSALKRKVSKCYNKCVELIKNQTEQNLPRKLVPKSAKVQVKVPENKVSGDTISFSNPHIPGQRLEAKVPDGKSAGEIFIVSVPMPAVLKSDTSENKLSKELVAALDAYSSVYDNWVQAEAVFKQMTSKKGDNYKPGVERLKKYDEMIKVFPKDLETPIDAAYLRLLVRRKRQNQNKKVKGPGSLSPSKTPTKKSAVIASKKLIEITIPSKGQKFPSIVYKLSDFDHE